MQMSIDFERVTRALQQEIRRHPEQQNRFDDMLFVLPAIISLCGEYSQTRRMASLIGKMLLADECNILVPCCPDYSHDGGRYTFHHLRGGISLLAEKHIVFLKEITALVPRANVTFLYADHEADNVELLQVVHKTKDEFVACVHDSIVATQDRIAFYGWKVGAMTEFMPDLVMEEERCYRWIAENPDFVRRISRETMDRAEMYFKIRRTMTDAEMRERTMGTAAQYVAFGRFAADRGCMISNHSTVNLSWYLQTDATILHNPVSIY